jgi:hypothetical protein
MINPQTSRDPRTQQIAAFVEAPGMLHVLAALGVAVAVSAVAVVSIEALGL